MTDKILEILNYILLTTCLICVISSNIIMVIILLILVCMCQQFRIDNAKNKTKKVQLQLNVYQNFICNQLRKYKRGIINGKTISEKKHLV